MFTKHQKQRSVKKDLVSIAVTMKMISNRDSWRYKATGVYIQQNQYLIQCSTRDTTKIKRRDFGS